MGKAKRIRSVQPTSRTSSRPTQRAQPHAHGIERTFHKTRPVCTVKFTLPAEAAPEAQKVCIVGDFNDWSREATPMQRHKKEGFAVSLELKKGRSYRFRYLIDDVKFENDWAADRYEPNPFGSEDSVIDL